MRAGRGILLMILAVTMFTAMNVCIKAAAVPAGQAVFFRAGLSVPVLLVWLAFRGQVRGGAEDLAAMDPCAAGGRGVGVHGAGLRGAALPAAAGGHRAPVRDADPHRAVRRRHAGRAHPGDPDHGGGRGARGGRRHPLAAGDVDRGGVGAVRGGARPRFRLPRRACADLREVDGGEGGDGGDRLLLLADGDDLVALHAALRLGLADARRSTRSSSGRGRSAGWGSLS